MSTDALALSSWTRAARARISLDWKALAPDLVIVALLALVGYVLCSYLYFQMSPAIHHWSTWDFWFESDPRRTYELSFDRRSIHHHSTSHHPLFSLFYFPPVFLLHKIMGMDPEIATSIVLSLGCAVFLALAYTTLRLIGLKRIDASIFSALIAMSAATLFWFPVPETFGFGAITVLAVIAIAAMVEKHGSAPGWVFVLASALSMSMTTTNWLAGLALLFVFLHWLRAVRHAVETMVLVLAAWAVQHTLFPESDTFLNIFRGSEVDYLFNDEALGIGAKLKAFFFHAIVMPDISEAFGYRLTVQPAGPGAGSFLSLAGAGIWAVLMVIAIWSIIHLVRERGLPQLKTILVLLLALAAQLLITLLFGIESFLYSAHFSALLVIAAALSALTPARIVATPLALALTVICGVNNLDKFDVARERIVAQYEHQRDYTGAFENLTDPQALIVCGAPALAGFGEGGMKRLPPETAEPYQVIHAVDPDTCAFGFDADLEPRTGWRLFYEDWSAAAIDTFAARGARYFATQYQYGIANKQSMFDELAQRYTVLARNENWVIYDLKARR